VASAESFHDAENWFFESSYSTAQQSKEIAGLSKAETPFRIAFLRENGRFCRSQLCLLITETLHYCFKYFSRHSTIAGC